MAGIWPTPPRRHPGSATGAPIEQLEAALCLCSRISYRPDDPAKTDQMWIDTTRVRFKGPIIVGKDLLEL
jgi:hypothetical protein